MLSQNQLVYIHKICSEQFTGINYASQFPTDSHVRIHNLFLQFCTLSLLSHISGTTLYQVPCLVQGLRPSESVLHQRLPAERAAEVARRESWASGHEKGKVAEAIGEKGKKTDELEEKGG